MSNKNTTILFHNISYFLRDTDLDITFSEKEHIEYYICQGYREGELNMTDPDNPDKNYSGYWKIDNKPREDGGLQFTCPKCKHNELSSVEQAILTYPVTKIPNNGLLEYELDNPTAGDSHILAYQCMNCGYELKNEQGNTIDECLQVVEWVKNNIPEKTDE